MAVDQVSNNIVISVPQDMDKETNRNKALMFKAHANTLAAATGIFSMVAVVTLLGAGLVNKSNHGGNLLDGINFSGRIWAPWAMATTFSAIAARYLNELAQAYDQMSQTPSINAHKDVVQLSTN